MSVWTKAIYIITLILFPLIIGCASDQSAVREKAQAMGDLGVSYYQQGNLREALKHLLDADKLDPENPDLHHELALVYRDLKDYDLSLIHFQKALSLRPQFPEAWNNLGTTYLLLKKWDLAIESFRKAADDILYKTPDIAYNNMGLAYYYKGDYREAIKSYQKALSILPRYTICRTNLGLAYEAIKEWDKAIETYKTSIQYDKINPVPYLRLGSLYHHLNRNTEAIKIINEFLSVVKEGPEIVEAQELLKKIEGK